MLLSSKHRLELNNKQRTLAFKHAGVARHAYNWGVQICKEVSEKREKMPSSIDLHKLLVQSVKSKNEWYYEVSKYAPQQALRNLNDAWKRYFSKLKKGEVDKKKKAYIKERKRKGLDIKNSKLFDMCKPNFKKKGVNDSFYLEGNKTSPILVKGNKIKLPIFGWIKMSEKYEQPTHVKNVVISRTADDWFVSFKQEVYEKAFLVPDIDKKPTIGVDLGIKTLAKLSDGYSFENPKAFNRNKRKLRILQRVTTKKFNKNSKKQSNNYEKSKRKVANLHQRISNIRKDVTHKLTTYLAKNHSVVKIEDLNVSGMIKNRRLASAISDGGFYEFRRQLEYKTKLYGSKLGVIDRFYPSSKMCSCCGNIKEILKLTEREYICKNCGLVIDRDLNAAINIKNAPQAIRCLPVEG